MRNNIVEKAKEINKKYVNWKCILPDVTIGDSCRIRDIWDGEGEIPETSYAFKFSDCGEDGESNFDIWINYQWDMIEEDEEDLSNSLIRITQIEFV